MHFKGTVATWALLSLHGWPLEITIQSLQKILFSFTSEDGSSRQESGSMGPGDSIGMQVKYFFRVGVFKPSKRS